MDDFIYDHIMPVVIVLALIGVVIGIATLSVLFVKAATYSFEAAHCSDEHAYGWFDFGDAGRRMTDLEYKEFCEK